MMVNPTLNNLNNEYLQESCYYFKTLHEAFSSMEEKKKDKKFIIIYIVRIIFFLANMCFIPQ